MEPSQQGYEQDNEDLKNYALKWLKAEYSTKTEARKALSVGTIINDTSIYDSLKIMSLFVRQAGYQGLLVNLDELVNLFKLNNSQARKSNYEQILRILNDTLQGNSENIGFLLGGTPEFLLDKRKGLYSYEALKSRLDTNEFAKQKGLTDYSSPILYLENLTKEELYLLLQNLRHVYAYGEHSKYLVPDEALKEFIKYCSEKIGDAYFKTPRETIKKFLDMLTVLEQEPKIQWRDLIGLISKDSANLQIDNDELTNFKI